MANTTKYLLAEQVMYRISGGYPDVSSPVDRRDIYKAIEQLINSQYKYQFLSVQLPSGESIPDNLCIGTFAGITVTSDTLGRSKATLPIMPVSLPKDLGVYQIYQAEYPESPFIPLPRGVYSLLKTDELLNDILGQCGYEVKGKTIVFTKDLPLYGISSVTMELIAMDITAYSETDYLPIPADYEATIIDQLVKMFAPIVPETALQNPYTTAGQQPLQK